MESNSDVESQSDYNESATESIADGMDTDTDMHASITATAAAQTVRVSHVSLAPRVLSQRLLGDSDQVAAIAGLERHVASLLLRIFRHRKDALLEAFYATEDADALLRSAGIVIAATPQISPAASFSGWECPVCYDCENDSLALACNHRFCTDCYARYLSVKITEEGEARNIQCLHSECNVIIDEPTIKRLVSDRVFEKYQTLLLRAYVDDTPSLKWCPAPNCENAIECKVPSSSLDEIVPTVTCSEGHEFCFGCLLPDHQPCVCSLVKLWLKKCADDSETANWISANTKECEKCQSTIEKNGGCNHMTCKKCKYEFCWVCMGPWTDHGTQWYNCNRYDEKAGIEARDNQAKSRSQLERYLHYFNRYANHEQSAKLDKQLSEQISKKMDDMQKTSDLSWIEVQFLAKAKEILLASRNTLKWTYSFAYYLSRNNSTLLFEDNQRDLEMAVEQLSGLLEGEFVPEKIAVLKQQVLDKSVYVAGRREVLLEATLSDLAEGKMIWDLTDKTGSSVVVGTSSLKK